VLLTASMLFAITYFVFNTLLVTLVVNLKRNEWPRLRTFLGSFGWVGFTYAGSALVAALLELTFQSFGIGVLVAAVPIIAMLLTTLHYYFRQQESDDRVLEARMQAAERGSGAHHATPARTGAHRLPRQPDQPGEPQPASTNVCCRRWRTSAPIRRAILP